MKRNRREDTLQEAFWKSDFGNNYTIRNKGENLVASNLSFFSNVFQNIKTGGGIKSIIEFGCNIGLNLIALHHLFPNAELFGIEINNSAFQELQKLPFVQSTNQSLYDYFPQKKYELAFTKGVLIHQPPEMLHHAYKALYESSSKYIMIAEYYNPTPVEVEYRGNKSVLFKRDFCGDLLDTYPEHILKNYGFIYHRDSFFPQDDITWFLLEKPN